MVGGSSPRNLSKYQGYQLKLFEGQIEKVCCLTEWLYAVKFRQKLHLESTKASSEVGNREFNIFGFQIISCKV